MRSRFLAPALALALLAGCIAPQDVPAQTNSAAYVPPAQRIDGMTAEETKVDKLVDCAGSMLLPAFCAERDLLVTGAIGVDALPVELRGANGPITIKAATDGSDAWSLHAVYRTRGLTEEDAKRALDEAFAWTHEEDGQHVLKAGPTRGDAPMPLPGLGSSLIAARYEVVLPAWVVLDVVAKSSNGPITIAGFRTTSVEAESSNGPIQFEGDAVDLRLETSNGPIDARVVPTASGTLTLESSNGPLDLQLVEGPRFGYDLDAATSNGRVKIDLEDGEVSQDAQAAGPQREARASFRTTDYDARTVQTVVALETSNGPIHVRG